MRFIHWIHNNLAILFLTFAAGVSAQVFQSTSPLSEGNIYKVGISETGIYSISYDFMINQLGVEPGSINSQAIHLYGHRGGALPELIADSYLDGLQDLNILILDNNDGSFDPGDRILFYGEGPSVWTYDEQDEIHHKPANPYDVMNYFFLVLNQNGADNSIPLLDYSGEPVIFTTNQGVHSQRLEEERTNLLFPFFASLGSGQQWFGDRFKGGGSKNYDEFFDMTHVPINSKLKIFSKFVGRSDQTTSFSIIINGEEFKKSISRTNISDVEAAYVKASEIQGETTLKDIAFHVGLEYPGSGPSSDGWLDYIEIHADQNLVLDDSPLRILNYLSTNHAYAKYRISGGSPETIIWDVTIPWDVHQLQQEIIGDGLEFVSPSDLLRTFYAFNPNQISAEPEAIGPVENQNIHGLMDADMLVVYHPGFKEAVNKYIEHRSSYSKLQVEAIDIEQVYNEFSSGRVDPTALRNFTRMLHKRDKNFRYLLLFGDATFDYRHIYSDNEDHNFVPTYQSKESFDPVLSFPSDDYFALLSDQEGTTAMRGALDISVGRFPVKTLDEAHKVVDKIIHYETSEALFGNWKLKAGFIADDEDGAMHLDQTEGIAGSFSQDNEVYNLEKIYFDGFKQESTPGGERYPDVNAAINKLFNQGSFVVNYMGHGGPKGWADERVLELQDIESWNNYDRLPLCVTATCTFSGYDDPTNVSPGELSFLNNKGGVIALFSTVRAVYSGSNRRLAQSVFNHITEPVNGTMPTLGEILQNAKNANAADTLSPANARKFLLIGDPALRLKYPKHRIQTTAVKDFNTGLEIDTLRALQKVTFEGTITNSNAEVLDNFNGTLFPTLYDKEIQVKTLQQNVGSQLREFDVQKNILYNGSVSVENGKFSFTFVLPKDINYTYGVGKMSYYATDLKTDASGWSRDFVIGGSAENSLQDDLGPDIQIYLNDRTFNDGDRVDNRPLLLVDLEDDSGINVTGNSIGHDLTATLNYDNQRTIILNEYYKSEINDISKGTAIYNLSELDPGVHQVTVKAWDIANNSNEATISFEIRERSKNIEEIYTQPNPMSDQTAIYFKHGYADLELNVQIEVFNAVGSKVADFQQNVFSDGYLAGPVQWNGSNHSGATLPAGVYFLRISATPLRGAQIDLKSDMHKIIVVK